jgi:hypothetical protein
MSKKICLIICLLSGLLITAIAAVPPPSESDKQEERIKAYFSKTPEELHQDVLKQQLSDQKWMDEQTKKDKKAVNVQIQNGQGVKTVPEPVVAPTDAGSAPSSTPPSGTAPSNSGAPKSPEDYSRGY